MLSEMAALCRCHLCRNFPNKEMVAKGDWGVFRWKGSSRCEYPQSGGRQGIFMGSCKQVHNQNRVRRGVRKPSKTTVSLPLNSHRFVVVQDIFRMVSSTFYIGFHSAEETRGIFEIIAISEQSLVVNALIPSVTR